MTAGEDSAEGPCRAPLPCWGTKNAAPGQFPAVWAGDPARERAVARLGRVVIRVVCEGGSWAGVSEAGEQFSSGPANEFVCVAKQFDQRRRRSSLGDPCRSRGGPYGVEILGDCWGGGRSRLRPCGLCWGGWP